MKVITTTILLFMGIVGFSQNTHIHKYYSLLILNNDVVLDKMMSEKVLPHSKKDSNEILKVSYVKSENTVSSPVKNKQKDPTLTNLINAANKGDLDKISTFLIKEEND